MSHRMYPQEPTDLRKLDGLISDSYVPVRENDALVLRKKLYRLT